MKNRQFTIGQRVKYSGKFLKSTGQGRGSAGLSTWTVKGITNEGRWVIVDEPADLSYFTAEELAADPTLAFRRIAKENLVIVGEIDSRNCP